MEIVFNGQRLQIETMTLEQLLADQQIEVAVVACAIDGHFIPKADYAATAITAGMRIEVLSPMQGG